MVMRLVVIVLVIVAFAAYFGNFSSQGNLSIENIQTSVATIAYSGELDEIKKAVDEFMYLRTIRGTAQADELAQKIDQRLNKLELVKMYCDEEISSIVLVNEHNPYEKLQQICPKLQDIPLSKAAQLFRLI